MIKPAPVSLRIIQVLTLLSAVFIGLFFMFRVVLSFVGWGPYSSQPLPNPPPITMGQLLYEIEFILPLIVSVSGLFLCAGMSYTYKIVWFASFVYWVLICVTFSSITYSIWTDYTSGEYAGFQNLAAWQIESLIVVLIPYVYAIGCSLYFLLSKNIRGYFDV
jgi:hypothetical protein